jgi:hypothetical protein
LTAAAIVRLAPTAPFLPEEWHGKPVAGMQICHSGADAEADLAGALNEREDDDGAVGNRDARYIGGFAGTCPPGTPADGHVAWVRDAWEFRPFSTGGNYVNFQLAEDDTARTADAYGKNYERIQRVKTEYDPDNFFRVNRNIPPA